MKEPAFYLHPKSILASRDDTVELKCGARGLPRPNITWLKDGIAFTDSSAKVIESNLNESLKLSMKVRSVSDRHVGYYACLATALKAQVLSRDAMLSLKGKYVDQSLFRCSCSRYTTSRCYWLIYGHIMIGKLTLFEINLKRNRALFPISDQNVTE